MMTDDPVQKDNYPLGKGNYTCLGFAVRAQTAFAQVVNATSANEAIRKLSRFMERYCPGDIYEVTVGDHTPAILYNEETDPLPGIFGGVEKIRHS